MAVEEKEIAALQRLGLTEYEARIYIALARMGATKASELSYFGSVPRTKTYGAIRELEKKDLLTVIPGKPEVYLIRSPREVLMPLVTKLETGVKESTSLVQDLTVAYESNKVVRGPYPRETKELWIIEGRANIISKLNELINSASKEINFCTSAYGLVRTYKANSKELEEARNRGISIKMLSPITTDNVSVAKEIASLVEVRGLKTPFPTTVSNFISVDSKSLLIVDANPDDLSSDKGSDLAAWSVNKLTIELHDQLFARIWESCMNLENFQTSHDYVIASDTPRTSR